MPYWLLLLYVSVPAALKRTTPGQTGRFLFGAGCRIKLSLSYEYMSRCSFMSILWSLSPRPPECLSIPANPYGFVRELQAIPVFFDACHPRLAQKSS